MQVQVQERRESTCIYSGTLDIGWSEVESAGNVRGGGRESHVLLRLVNKAYIRQYLVA